jgi:hypothetical protein
VRFEDYKCGESRKICGYMSKFFRNYLYILAQMLDWEQRRVSVSISGGVCNVESIYRKVSALN